MDISVSLFTILLIAANVIVSLFGLKNRIFYERYLFHVGSIIKEKQYSRLVTSGFLHVNLGHLMLNMFALYSFSFGVEGVLGTASHFIIYFGSLIAGSLLSLWMNRNHHEYRAVGASGAVSGVIFANVVMFPGSAVSFLFLPIAIPSWLFGIGFILISIFGIRSRWGHIGHAAHLGGAIAGVLLVIILEPRVLLVNPLVIAAVLVPALLFIAAPTFKVKSSGFRIVKRSGRQKMDEESVEERALWRQMNELLDRVNEYGMDGLSEFERRRLKELSARLKDQPDRR